MIRGTERLFESRCAVPADRQKSIGEAEALFLTNARQPLSRGDASGRAGRRIRRSLYGRAPAVAGSEDDADRIVCGRR